ncbi:Hypothetical_protein [Hexamita inflata]|uniref:Hypothetical_protein n=1 Tax=Hexamita inflata TaxID=28002 RepID=A0AA86UQD0_9EUKA|nr:Hypothetical protein HINF_LOCUS55200 [Hexamita inflata]
MQLPVLNKLVFNSNVTLQSQNKQTRPSQFAEFFQVESSNNTSSTTNRTADKTQESYQTSSQSSFVTKIKSFDQFESAIKQSYRMLQDLQKQVYYVEMTQNSVETSMYNFELKVLQMRKKFRRPTRK